MEFENEDAMKTNCTGVATQEMMPQRTNACNPKRKLKNSNNFFYKQQNN